MPRNYWTYEQDLAVLYGKIKHGRDFRGHPDVQRLSNAMGRTHAALCMRKGNFDSFAATLRLRMPSATSSTASGSTISPRAVSPPTPPGWPSK